MPDKLFLPMVRAQGAISALNYIPLNFLFVKITIFEVQPELLLLYSDYQFHKVYDRSLLHFSSSFMVNNDLFLTNINITFISQRYL